jgi:SpoVK/Ycf46/Vps4 family AAA+-type ATPase
MKTALNQSDLKGILNGIWEATRSINFTNPEEAFKGDPKNIRGFPQEKLEIIKRVVISPFERWANFSGTKEECEIELKNLPRGLILYGPPGNGKTYLTKWIAKSIGLPVRVVNSAAVKASLYGDTEKNVHRLFYEARKASPCVIVLDDADDLFPDRDSVGGSTSGVDRGIVNAALQELEGFGESPDGILVIMATNRFRSLDKAIRSRLSFCVKIPYPLDEDQIGEIVDSFATEHHFILDDKVKSMLKEHFMRTKKDVNIPDVEKPEIREGLNDNLFSVREIRQAILLLKDGQELKYSKGWYKPDPDDVNRMAQDYKQSANS